MKTEKKLAKLLKRELGWMDIHCIARWEAVARVVLSDEGQEIQGGAFWNAYTKEGNDT